MDKPLTIAYFTCRLDPKIEWFFYSLNRELKNDWNNINIIIIDYHFQFTPKERSNYFIEIYKKYTNNVLVTSPKPTVWQGKYKKTKNDFFAASNARNTAFIYCQTDYIVCVDDLTVLKEGWLEVVKWGMLNNFIILGAYAKVKELNCDVNGEYYFKKEEISIDSRFNSSSNNNPMKVNGNWLYGCSFGLPLKDILSVDGFDESCDGQGAEDYDFGIRLERISNNIFYCKKMFSYESEELHFVSGNARFIGYAKIITEKGTLKEKIGIMSDHAKLEQVLASNSPLPYHPTNLLKLRENKNFPSPDLEFDWRDGQLLNEM